MAFTRFRKNHNYYKIDNRFSKPFERRSRPSRGFDVDKLRKYVEDGYDVDMDAGQKTHSNHRFNPLKGRQYYPKGGRIRGTYTRGGGFGRSILAAPSSCYKVTVYHGNAYERQDFMKKLQNYVKPVLFVPFGLRVDADNLVFFVDNKKASEAINRADLKIEMKDGCLMQIKVESIIPIVDMNSALKDKITRVLSSKYDTTSQHLNLSRFYANDEFLKEDQLVLLSQRNLASGVFQIIDENVPKLKSLNLSSNKIFTMQNFFLLKNRANELKSMNLSKNRINSLKDLKCLEGLKLDSLVLDCNPLCNYFQDSKEYVREVRKIFPTLRYLDEVALSPPPSLDCQETNLNASSPTTPVAVETPPTNHSNLMTNPDGRDFTRQFLEVFYSMYDNSSGDRSALNEAYALTGEFSLTTSNFSGVNSNKFITENRHSIRVNNHLEGRTELLLIGKQNIVKFLSTLPKTQHDLTSFHVDLLVFTPELVSLRITGVFREAEYAPSPIKAFNREFTLISNGSGFSIVKDCLCITEASSEQTNTAFGPRSTSNKQVTDVSNLLKSSLCLDTDISAATPAPSPSAAGISQERQDMVVALAKHTRMNLLWSKKCLDETNWELQKAIEVFTEFHKRNAIPAEAFV